MKRLAIGAALGGFALYLFDRGLGEERRERLLSHLREYRGSAVQAGRAASQAAETGRRLSIEAGLRSACPSLSVPLPSVAFSSTSWNRFMAQSAGSGCSPIWRRRVARPPSKRPMLSSRRLAVSVMRL